jgi:hypothetical protein
MTMLWTAWIQIFDRYSQGVIYLSASIFPGANPFHNWRKIWTLAMLALHMRGNNRNFLGHLPEHF